MMAVGVEGVADPVVGALGSGGWLVGRVVVDADGVIAEAAWRLDHDDDVAELESCDVDVAGFWVCVVGSGGFAQWVVISSCMLVGRGVEEGEVGVAWECEGVVGEDVVGEPFGVVSAGIN